MSSCSKEFAVKMINDSVKKLNESKDMADRKYTEGLTDAYYRAGLITSIEHSEYKEQLKNIIYTDEDITEEEENEFCQDRKEE